MLAARSVAPRRRPRTPVRARLPGFGRPGAAGEVPRSGTAEHRTRDTRSGRERTASTADRTGSRPSSRGTHERWRERPDPEDRVRRQAKRREPPIAREHRVGLELAERDEDEPAFVHARMRHDEVRLVDRGLVERQDVDVDRARPPALAPYAAERDLDRQNRRQQLGAARAPCGPRRRRSGTRAAAVPRGRSRRPATTVRPRSPSVSESKRTADRRCSSRSPRLEPSPR